MLRRCLRDRLMDVRVLVVVVVVMLVDVKGEDGVQSGEEGDMLL
jgi:hypothetical protein